MIDVTHERKRRGRPPGKTERKQAVSITLAPWIIAWAAEKPGGISATMQRLAEAAVAQERREA